MFRRFSASFLAILLLAACAAQPAPAPTPAPSAAPSPSAASGPSPSAAPEVSEAIILDRCPTYDEAMAAVSGPGDSGEQLDAETCLQNAYALAAALYNGDAGAAAAACDAAAVDTDRAASAEDIFPFADLSGLQLQGFSFSGGGAGEPLWLTLSVAAPGETMLPEGTTTYAVEFGDGWFVAAGCVQALVEQPYYLPQTGSAYTTVHSFRTWVTDQPWRDANDLPPLRTAYYLSGFAAGRGLEPSGGPGSGVWAGEILAAQAQDAFGLVPEAFKNRWAAAFTDENFGCVYDEAADTFQLAASPGDGGRNRRMSAFEEKADGAVSLTIARGCNSLWMRPDRQITYTLRQNADGSWAILRAGWAGGHKTPEYQIWGTSVRLGNGRPLPDTLPLVGESGLTWQQAADRFDMTVEELQTLNPDVRIREDGVILDRLLLDPAYALPDPNAQRVVRILLPWETYQGTHTYTLPDGLDEQAYIVAAEALDFLWHSSVRTGYTPAEQVEDERGELYQAAEGARFTSYSELKAHLASVFTPELAESYASGGYDAQSKAYFGYLPGNNDELRFGVGERGTSPLVLTQLCTEPVTQADGSVTFGLLGLERDGQDTRAYEESEPVRAVWHTIRLVPAADGWRVAEAELAV